MNGKTRSVVIARPFRMPTTPPIATPAAIAVIGLPPSRSSTAVTTPVSAIDEPTERSMPPRDDDHRHADRAERDGWNRITSPNPAKRTTNLHLLREKETSRPPHLRQAKVRALVKTPLHLQARLNRRKRSSPGKSRALRRNNRLPPINLLKWLTLNRRKKAK